MQLGSVSGDIHLAIKQGEQLYIDASSLSGDMVSEIGLEDAPSAGSETARCRELSIRTVSGDVQIVRAAVVPRLTSSRRPRGARRAAPSRSTARRGRCRGSTARVPRPCPEGGCSILHLPETAAALERLIHDDDLAWQCYAMARLAEHLADDE